ncbi:hypothetical protein C5167_049907 [Papaver somniferum]|uniref:Uncharacterized protein n=2 Tax=Papaver somniferum TaxID=3469 RepID=A0A4Y7KPX1_PAPSO|nr:uncharacterized protein LOC113303369 isoform X1 [Papaver somniferum]RZC74432.1 hypothetical protein C5167_049913 [Papaver somniferum]RZC74433.1 hypothetical protein C5167_049907 [Papaver somniferum]
MFSNFVKRVYRLPEDMPSSSATMETTVQTHGDTCEVTEEPPNQAVSTNEPTERLDDVAVAFSDGLKLDPDYRELQDAFRRNSRNGTKKCRTGRKKINKRGRECG